MMRDKITIKGARVNNLKNVDIEIPLQKLVCISGPSGSGKSSLAFHTLYTESKRRFLNSFPTNLKFFNERPAPVDVDEIVPVLPVFALPQINPVLGARSVVSDILSLTESLQELYSVYSEEKCPLHNTQLSKQLLSDCIKKEVENLASEKTILYICCLQVDFQSQFPGLPYPSRSIESIDSLSPRDFSEEDDFWELLRIRVEKLSSINDKLDFVINSSLRNLYVVLEVNNAFIIKRINLSSTQVCKECGYTGVDNKKSAYFSAYNALGACQQCKGFGSILEYDTTKMVKSTLSVSDGGVSVLEFKKLSKRKEAFIAALMKNKIPLNKPIEELNENFWKIFKDGYGNYPGIDSLILWLNAKKYRPSIRMFIRRIQSENICNACNGTRLSGKVANFYLPHGKNNFTSIWHLTIGELYRDFSEIDNECFDVKGKKIFLKILEKLKTSLDIGLGHLKLMRKAKTLSAGEYQRLLLMKYLAYQGTNSLFIFDEPSVGLSEAECANVLNSMRALIKQGNTILLVEHSDYLKRRCDYLIEMGPGAGHLGGEVCFEGLPKDFLKENSFIQNDFLKRNCAEMETISVTRPKMYDLEFSSFQIFRNSINLVTGKSGSGKTTAIVDILGNYLLAINNKDITDELDCRFEKISGNTNFKDILIVDSRLNRFTSRSSVGSLSELNTVLRKHYVKLPMSKSMGLVEGHFSTNSEQGQCSACRGSGTKIIDMQYLEDVILTCEDCGGKGLKPYLANISDQRFTVFEAFSKPMNQIMPHIKLTPKFQRIWSYIKLLKLDYLALNREVNSLSGGEKQRMFMLSKIMGQVDNHFIVFENLSFGLSNQDIESVFSVLLKLREQNNTIVLIDQHAYFKNSNDYTLTF